MADLLEIPLDQPIYQVSQLNIEVRNLLENQFPYLSVIGEISNLATPGSGHIYFTLKDSKASVKCALFKKRGQQLEFTPQNGHQVLVQAQVTLYEARGDFQLIIQHMQLAGEGALQLAFAKLKQKLDYEGLFNPSYKKKIPHFVACVGVITSPSGAAIQDIIQIIKRRSPHTNIIIYPSLVQGNTAANTIVTAIETANARKECEVIILARGGGSLEDLWPFNEEIVARAIFNSLLPIVSAIGHEIDFTIADFVADLRAPTPSAAAEIITPNWAEYLKQFNHLYFRLLSHSQHFYQEAQLKLIHLQKKLKHPAQQLEEISQKLTRLEYRLFKIIQLKISESQIEIQTLKNTLFENHPKYRLIQFKNRITQFTQKMIQAIQHHHALKKEYLSHLSTELNTVSPLKTLERGYAIVSSPQGKIIRNAEQIKTGECLRIQLANGELQASRVD